MLQTTDTKTTENKSISHESGFFFNYRFSLKGFLPNIVNSRKAGLMYTASRRRFCYHRQYLAFFSLNDFHDCVAKPVKEVRFRLQAIKSNLSMNKNDKERLWSFLENKIEIFTRFNWLPMPRSQRPFLKGRSRLRNIGSTIV